jgi:O-antigen ligase
LLRSIVFVVGLVFLMRRWVRDPVWATLFGMYVYFAIPHQEFYAPSLPYQAAGFFVGILGVGRFRSIQRRELREAFEARLFDAGDAVIETSWPKARSAFLDQMSRAGADLVATPSMEEVETVLVEEARKIAPGKSFVSLQRALISGLRLSMQDGLQNLRSRHSELVALRPGERLAVLENDIVPLIRPRWREVFIREIRPTWEEVEALPETAGPVAGVLLNPGLYLHLMFIALTYFGAVYAVYNAGKAMDRYRIAVLLLIPLVSMAVSLRTPKHIIWAGYAWLLGVSHLAYNGVSKWLSYGGRAENIGGQGGESNFLGGIIVSVAAVAFGLVLEGDRRHKIAGLAASGLMVLGILASGSRGGLMAFMAASGYWLLHTRRRSVALGLASLACALFLLAAPENFWNRMGTIFGVQDKNQWVSAPVEPSKAERLALWTLAIQVFERHPVFGIGAMNFTDVSAEETDFVDAYHGAKGLQAHNTWLQLLAEYGLVGTSVWAGAFFLGLLCFRMARRRLQKWPEAESMITVCLGLEAGMVGTALVYSFNSFQWYDYAYWYMVLGPAALLAAREFDATCRWLAPDPHGGEPESVPPPRFGLRPAG